MTLTQKRAQGSFKTRLLLHLADRRRRSGAEAFTLVELMIVVAVIGILSAVALPAFLGARSAADAGAKVGEALGLAKECATYVVSNIGAQPANCTSGAGGSYVRTFGTGAEGVKCLTDTSASTDNTATVSVDSAGQITCAFS